MGDIWYDSVIQLLPPSSAEDALKIIDSFGSSLLLSFS